MTDFLTFLLTLSPLLDYKVRVCNKKCSAPNSVKGHQCQKSFSHELLNPNQSGFRPNDSTVNPFISITYTTVKAFDCNPPLELHSVYLNISKAFGRVCHDGLVYILKRCGVSGQFLPLVQSFLMFHKQPTVLNGQSSNWGDISAGVPQGSIFGPLLSWCICMV